MDNAIKKLECLHNYIEEIMKNKMWIRHRLWNNGFNIIIARWGASWHFCLFRHHRYYQLWASFKKIQRNFKGWNNTKENSSYPLANWTAHTSKPYTFLLYSRLRWQILGAQYAHPSDMGAYLSFNNIFF